MKKKFVCFSLILLGVLILPKNVLAVETGLNGDACAGQISLQHLNQANDVGRYWNISIGFGKDRARVYCMDEGKKARTGEVCVKQRAATSEEVKDVLRLVENPEALNGVDAKTADNIQISAGQGNLSDASIRMAMLSSGYDEYSANRVANQIMNSNSNQLTAGGGGWSVYICNGDGTGDSWQRMLVPDTYNSCYVPEKGESCPGGEMKMEGSIGKCENSSKDGNGQQFEFTYSATSGSLHSVHQNLGQDLGAAVGKYCKVYCTEEGTAIMPGATGEALQLGSYIIWPTSDWNFTVDKYQPHYYPLRFHGELKCNLEIMTDLEPTHANMPTGCSTDVVGIYQKNWNTIIQLNGQYDWYKQDSFKTYEQIRKINIGRTTDPGGACRANYNPGGKDCNAYGGIKRYMVMGHYKQYKGCESTLEEGVGPETSWLNKLKAEYNALACSEDETETKCDTCPGENNTTHDCNCRQELTACAKSKRAKAAEVRAQQAVVNDLNSKLSAVRGSISTCTSYVTAYEMDARIHHQMFLCSSWNISSDDYQFSSSARMEYSDYTKKKKDENLKWYTTGDVELVGEATEKTSGSSSGFVTKDIPDGSNVDVGAFYNGAEFESIISSLKDRTYFATQTDYYKLKTKYHWLDKNKLIYTTNKPENVVTDEDGVGVDKANFIRIKTKMKEAGEVIDNLDDGVIPTSYDNEPEEEYDLGIYDIVFGQAGFGSNDDGTGSSYVCKQKFVKRDDKCICPENTLNAGKSVECVLKGLTCLDALSKYCDDPTYEEEEGCTLYCEKDPTMPLTPCLNTGKTIEECNQGDYCDPYHCPNSAGVDDPGMDERLRDCVVTQMSQGLTKQRAIEVCEPQVCYGGRTIIYRTIKLENPFPSYNADENVEQDLNGKKFNTTVTGRYPGKNWNSEEVVNKKIINNRGASGSAIYQTREPLYTFILNTATIYAIRDYNDGIDAGYNDFSLLCKKDRSAACISEFVHNRSLSGLVGGTCATATSKDEFNTCVTNEGKQS